MQAVDFILIRGDVISERGAYNVIRIFGDSVVGNNATVNVQFVATFDHILSVEFFKAELADISSGSGHKINAGKIPLAKRKVAVDGIGFP